MILFDFIVIVMSEPDKLQKIHNQLENAKNVFFS